MFYTLLISLWLWDLRLNNTNVLIFLYEARCWVIRYTAVYWFQLHIVNKCSTMQFPQEELRHYLLQTQSRITSHIDMDMIIPGQPNCNNNNFYKCECEIH